MSPQPRAWSRRGDRGRRRDIRGGAGRVVAGLASVALAAALGLCGALASCGDAVLTPIVARPGAGLGGAAGQSPTGGASGAAGAGGRGVAPADCPDALVGFATLMGGTDGGGAATPSVVTTAEQLTTLAGQEAPAVIHLAATLDLSAQVRVRSNKTILGMTPTAGLRGSGLNLTGSQNVIIRNIAIAKAVDVDAIQVQQARRIWIDHCDLSSDLDSEKGTYDGLVDITRASDAVTVSWNVLRDHFDVSLVGHSSTNADEDTGHLTVTFHHNAFVNMTGAAPRVRFGTVHVFNNVYRGSVVAGKTNMYGIGAQLGAIVRIENNVFDQMGIPISTNYEGEAPGAVDATGNMYVDGSDARNEITTAPAVWTPPYPFTADSAAGTPVLVDACAGVGHLKL